MLDRAPRLPLLALFVCILLASSEAAALVNSNTTVVCRGDDCSNEAFRCPAGRYAHSSHHFQFFFFLLVLRLPPPLVLIYSPCLGKSCSYSCEGLFACAKASILCEPNAKCFVSCTGINSCMNLRLDCNETTARCNMSCTQRGSCFNLTYMYSF